MEHCNLRVEGKCKSIQKHGLFQRTLASVFGTSPGLMILLFSSQFFSVVTRVTDMVPGVFYSFCAVAMLAYLSIIWQSAHVPDRAKMIDYLTQTAATFSTTIATLPFLKGVFGQ
jgi:ACR3 family arsenite efflux pump ArsB